MVFSLTGKRLRGAMERLVSLMEGFAVLPDRDADYACDLDSAAELGARAICAVSMDRDAGRTHAVYAQLAEQAAERGLVTTTEACAGVYRSLAKAMGSVAA